MNAVTSTVSHHVSTIPFVEVHDHRGRVGFNVGDYVYLRENDQYGEIEAIVEVLGSHFSKIRLFEGYETDSECGIDYAEMNNKADYRFLPFSRIPAPLVVSFVGDFVHFISSLRFNMDYIWMEEHIHL